MKREYELIIVCLGLVLIILGVIMQYKVIINNNCMMPVYDSPDAEKSNEHFNYQNMDNINYWHLSDIIGWSNERISVGDLFIWFGSILLIAFSVRYSIKLLKEDSA